MTPTLSAPPVRSPFLALDGSFVGYDWIRWFLQLQAAIMQQLGSGTVYTGSTDAIAYPGVAVLKPASGIDAATLAASRAGTDDFDVLTVINGAASASTVTAPANSIVDGSGTPKHLATFSANVGGCFMLLAYGGAWYLVGTPQGVTIS